MVTAKSKLFDNLTQVLATVSDSDLVPVLIMAQQPGDLPQLERVAGPIQVRYRYQVVPAIAALVTKEQVEILASQQFVRQIEYDAQVQIQLDGATRWFGAQKAREDFNVTGNRDRQPGYSTGDIVVAIVDTGIDANHVDLGGGKVIAFKDWVSNRTAPYDDHGHGSHVAGIVAGTGAGNPAYTGVAPGAALIGLKALDQNGSGSLSNVAAAVDWAVANKAEYNIKIISITQI